MSKKPTDYIFVIAKQDGLGWCAVITPRKYFEKEGCMYDQHLPITIPKWYDDMEGFYTHENANKMTPLDMYNDLKSKGFVPDETFGDFLGSSDGILEIFTPDEDEAVQLANITGASLKDISTEDCVKRIGEVLAKVSGLEQYATAKWKRSSKKTTGGNTVRVFSAKDCPDYKISLTSNAILGIFELEIFEGSATFATIPCQDDECVDAWVEQENAQDSIKNTATPSSGPYKYFSFQTGYVESASIGSVFVRHNTGFQDPEEGIAHFIACVREILKKDTGKKDISLWEVREYVEGLFSSTNDSMGTNSGEDWEDFQTMGWSVPAFCDPDRDPNAKVLFVNEFLWRCDDVEDDEAEDYSESLFYGEWTEATLTWTKGRRKSKAAEAVDKKRWG